MRKLVLIAILSWIFVNSDAQNLVPNYSFETYNSCPDNLSQVTRATPWFNPVNAGSADYFNGCTTNPNISVPANNWGNQPAATGNAYVGLASLLYSSQSDYREYASVKLISPLEACVDYVVSFKCSLADRSMYYTDGLGVYLSNNPVSNSSMNVVLNFTPNYTLPSMLTNLSGWDVHTFIYTANGGEEYLTVGNFLDDASTNVSLIGSNYYNGSYVFVDDFSIVRLSFYLGNDTAICENETLLLDASTPNATYLWQDGSTNPTYLVSQQGIYSVAVTFNSCTIYDTIVVSYMNTSVNLGNDTAICEGDTITLNAFKLNASYSWQDYSTYQIFNVTTTGVYFVQIKINDCYFWDTINIIVDTIPSVELGNDTVICEGDHLVMDVSAVGQDYLWQNNSTSPIFSISKEGIYWVEVSNNNCRGSDTIFVQIDSLPELSWISDSTLCDGMTLTLTAPNTDASILWNDNSIGTSMIVTKSGEYSLQLRNGCGVVSDTINLEFEDCVCEVFVPNTFTPNGDGLNDTFLPVFNCVFESYRISIYDRWGLEVFSASSPTESWSGNESQIGLYAYVIRYTPYGQHEKVLYGKVIINRK